MENLKPCPFCGADKFDWNGVQHTLTHKPKCFLGELMREEYGDNVTFFEDSEERISWDTRPEAQENLEMHEEFVGCRRNVLKEVIMELEQVTSGNISHHRKGLIGMLKTEIAIYDLRLQKPPTEGEV